VIGTATERPRNSSTHLGFRRRPRLVTQRLDAVRLPARVRPALPVLKLAAAAGLIAGRWIDALGAVTVAAITVNFLLAVGAHLRVRDVGRNLFNASVLLVFSAYVLATFV
jgi:hypothetical protein